MADWADEIMASLSEKWAVDGTYEFPQALRKAKADGVRSADDRVCGSLIALNNVLSEAHQRISFDLKRFAELIERGD